MRMFEVGDRVMVNGFCEPMQGVIMSHIYDEGHVWVVKTDCGSFWDCSSDELTPA